MTRTEAAVLAPLLIVHLVTPVSVSAAEEEKAQAAVEAEDQFEGEIGDVLHPSARRGRRSPQFHDRLKSLRWDNQLFLVDEPVNVNVATPGRMQMS